MVAPSRGMGVSPFGLSAYGYGTPVVAPIPGGAVYRDDHGVIRGSRKLKFGDRSSLLPIRTGAKYEYDSYGRAKGMPDVQHLVTIAALMVKGSSVAKDIGNRFYEARYVTPNLQQEMEARVQEAFKPLIDQEFIRIDSITVEPNGGMPTVTRVRITDLTIELPLDEVTITG